MQYRNEPEHQYIKANLDHSQIQNYSLKAEKTEKVGD